MTERCWWQITGAVSRRSLEAQEQERDTRNPTVRVVVECEGLDEVLHSLIKQTFSVEFSSHSIFRPSSAHDMAGFCRH